MTDGRDLVGVLLMAHGTPATPEEIPGFYTEIRRGRPPSPELLDDLVRRYEAIGGTSPLQDRTRAQATALTAALDTRAPGRFVLRLGTKFAAPRIEEAVAELDRAGVSSAVGLVLAPHSSTVSVGEYARRAEEAAAAQGRPFHLELVDHWHLAPGLVPLLAGRVLDALDRLPEADRAGAVVVFTAHSVPTGVVEAGDPYPAQVEETARAVAAEAGLERWSVAWQSAGRTEEPWLGPDLLAVLPALAAGGTTTSVVCPVGFVSDHLEILYDLDIEAAGVASAAGMTLTRTDSLNDDPAFADILAGVVLEAAG